MRHLIEGFISEIVSQFRRYFSFFRRDSQQQLDNLRICLYETFRRCVILASNRLNHV